jgi:hypothetical protein
MSEALAGIALSCALVLILVSCEALWERFRRYRAARRADADDPPRPDFPWVCWVQPCSQHFETARKLIEHGWLAHRSIGSVPGGAWRPPDPIPRPTLDIWPKGYQPRQTGKPEAQHPPRGGSNVQLSRCAVCGCNHPR